LSDINVKTQQKYNLQHLVVKRFT